MSQTELADVAPRSGGGGTGNSGDDNSEGGVLLRMPSAYSEPFDEQLTAEELLYMKVYEPKLMDAGYVTSGAPPSTPPPWRLMHKTSVLTQLRLIRWLAFMVCFAIGVGTGIYLLITTVRGYKLPVLQTTILPRSDDGLYVPIFGVCGTILQPVAYEFSGDESPKEFEFKTFKIGVRKNLHILANDTMRRPSPFPSSSDSKNTAPYCFRYNWLEAFLPKVQYGALQVFLSSQLYFDMPEVKFSRNSWNPCIVCIQPKRVKTAQSIRVDWDLPGIDQSSSPTAASESVVDRFNRITSDKLNLYKGLKFNVPLNTVAFATLNCSGRDFPTGVDSSAVEGDGDLSLSRSLCLSHLNDADASTRTSLQFPTSDTTYTPTNPQQIAVPSSASAVISNRIMAPGELFVAKKSVQIGTTSQLDQFQVSTNDYCSSFWNTAILYPQAMLISNEKELRDSGESTDLKPCVTVSLSAESKIVTKSTWAPSEYGVIAAIGVWISYASFAYTLHGFLTGERTLTTSALLVPTANMRRYLSASLQNLLPKSLLEKLSRRKLYVQSYEEQQSRGEYFKLV